MNQIENERAQRHNERMKRRKEVVDKKINQATIERGVVVLITGNGKGKTTSALGMLARNLGHGHRCALIQFIKGEWNCGEDMFFSGHENLVVHRMNTGFTWDTQNFEADRAAAMQVWEKARPLLANPDINLVVFDELTYMLNYHYLDSKEVIDAIRHRPPMQHVVITGRGASKELIELADTVSEVTLVKHAFNEGVKAQKGVEW